MKLYEMRPGELRQAVQNKLPVFVAFGAVEYHGEHLPLGVDGLIAQGIIEEIEKRAPIVVAPPISVAPTMHWAGGPEDGDMDFSGGPLLEYLREYLQCLLACGFPRIYVMLGHQGLDGDPGTLIKRAYWDITERDAKAFGPGWGRCPEKFPGAEQLFSRVCPVLYDQFCDYSGMEERLPVGHAGRGETQMIQALYPGLAQMEKLTEQPRPWPQWLEDVEEADPEQGRFWVDFCVEAWVRHLQEET